MTVLAVLAVLFAIALIVSLATYIILRGGER
jgi:hypothetical protein